ncbi:MAG: ATP-dependent metallopeptidase FtsH/Yme1/Tma family protein [Treponema sp.]|nr:ATP-dependent metallopeptidase FtsH/Yme1/Tma family protein [Treponema sp.]
MKKIRLRQVIFLLIALGVAAFIAYSILFPNGFDDSATHVSYKEFYESVEQGSVETATLRENNITFTKYNDSTVYATENPDSPLLKELLMRHGVAVREGVSAEKIIYKILDYSFYIIFFVVLFVLFKRFISPSTFRVVRKTGVTFKDVVGMENIKRDMTQVLDIMLHPESYKRRGIRMPKGILLEGAPGNGKTLFARALAGEAHVNFIPAKATDFESMFMAIGPAKVKLLFRKARKRAPCIVFIDEFDGIGTRRNYSGSAIETENTRIVTALLNELDGFQTTSGILVLAATNSIHALDEALIRPGRFDARFAVPYPDEAARRKLVELYSRGKAHSAECTDETLAKLFSGFSCAKIESVLNRASLIASQNGRDAFTLDDVRAATREQ